MIFIAVYSELLPSLTILYTKKNCQKNVNDILVSVFEVYIHIDIYKTLKLLWCVHHKDNSDHCVSEWHILIRVFTFLCHYLEHFLFIIFQLGAGVSLPGIVAGKCGAHVTLSDTAEIPLCLENSRRCCELNNLSGVSVVGLTWGEISPELTSLPPMDIILGSDVFYEPEGETVPDFM